MLHNLVDGLPSPKLIRDLRTLCSLGSEELGVIREVFLNLPEVVSEEAIAEALSPRTLSLKTDLEKFTASVKAAFFIWSQWSRRGLAKEQIVSDLQALDISPEQVADILPLLEAIEQTLGVNEKQRAERHALGTGTPRIQSAACVVDARAIFKSSKYEEDLGEGQPYYELDRFMPIVVLEIVSELNEEETTASYLMAEESLDELCDILRRARKRLNLVKGRLRASDSEKEPTDE